MPFWIISSNQQIYYGIIDSLRNLKEDLPNLHLIDTLHNFIKFGCCIYTEPEKKKHYLLKWPMHKIPAEIIQIGKDGK